MVLSPSWCITEKRETQTMENYTAKIPLTLNITYKADEELTFDQIVNIIRMKAWSDNSDELELLNHHWAE